MSAGATGGTWRPDNRNAVAPKIHKFRIGQYQETDLAHTRASYFDNVRIGTRYDAVDPTRTR